MTENPPLEVPRSLRNPTPMELEALRLFHHRATVSPEALRFVQSLPPLTSEEVEQLNTLYPTLTKFVMPAPLEGIESTSAAILTPEQRIVESSRTGLTLTLAEEVAGASLEPIEGPEVEEGPVYNPLGRKYLGLSFAQEQEEYRVLESEARA